MNSMLGAPRSIEWRPLITRPLCKKDEEVTIRVFNSATLKEQFMRAGPALTSLDGTRKQPRIDYFFSNSITLYDGSDSHLNVRDVITPMGNPIRVDAPAFLLSFTIQNAGHAQSELIYFLNHMSRTFSHNGSKKIFVCKVIQDKMKFVFDLLIALIGEDNVNIIHPDQTYFFKELEVVTVGRFLGLPWAKTKKVKLTQIDKCYKVNLEHDFFDEYPISPSSVYDYAQMVAKTECHKYTLYDKIFFVKSVSPESMCSPQRAMVISHEVQAFIESNGYKTIHLEDFASLEHLICVLGNAKMAITSYGNISCSNRFYYSKYCSLILLANRSYRREYSVDGHIVHSHIFPVANQYITLDFPDRPQVQDFSHLESLM
jgi:hypothetical protein